MALLIYKQWHRQPNRKGTPPSNAQHLKYIGERVHVAKPENAEHGLFGLINGQPAENQTIQEMMSYINKVSRRGTTVFRSVISFAPERAEMLELNSFDRWRNYVRYHLHSLAEHNQIKLENIEYTAAVHLKKGQPHVHITFWDKAQAVGKNYVSPAVPDAVRQELEKESFGRIKTEQSVLNENFSKDNSADIVRKSLIKESFKNELSFYNKNKDTAIKSLGIVAKPQIEAIIKKVFSHDKSTIVEQLDKVLDSLPKKGRLSYGLIDKEIKAELDRFTELAVLEIPELAALWESYLENKSLLATAYNSEDTNFGRLQIARIMGKAKDELYRKLGNVTLSAYKSVLRGQSKAAFEEYQKAKFANEVFGGISAILRLFNDKSSDELAQAGEEVFGKGDLSKEAIKELIYKKRDRENER